MSCRASASLDRLSHAIKRQRDRTQLLPTRSLHGKGVGTRLSSWGAPRICDVRPALTEPLTLPHRPQALLHRGEEGGWAGRRRAAAEGLRREALPARVGRLRRDAAEGPHSLKAEPDIRLGAAAVGAGVQANCWSVGALNVVLFAQLCDACVPLNRDGRLRRSEEEGGTRCSAALI